jgi:hypothetical protein
MRPSSSETAPSFFQSRHLIRARHRTVHDERPEPAQTVGSAARHVDAPDLPPAGKDGVVRAVLVDAGAEAGGRIVRVIGLPTFPNP